jgi:SAM-dependent methyltransferase
MVHNNKEVLDYWNQDEIESMYDKHLINSEIHLIKKQIRNNSKILDAGCGEGEGTFVYADIPGVILHAVDFSETRLKKAKRKLHDKKNVTLEKVDFLGEYNLDKDYDFVVSQRFLINLMEWDLQKKVLINLMDMLKKGGRLLMLEGSVDGVAELNDFRKIFKMDPIGVKWHNLFFDDKKMIDFMQSSGFNLVAVDGLGEYFMLTRGIRPVLDKDLNWDSEFNLIATDKKFRDILGLKDRLSRLKLWIFEK